MTLTNNYNTPNKIRIFFNQAEEDRSAILIEESKQGIIIDDIKRTEPKINTIKNFFDYSFDWVTPVYQTIDNDEVTAIYQTWQVDIDGLRFEQLPALRHNFLFRFGSEEEPLAEEIISDTLFYMNKEILSNSIENDNENSYSIHYGIYMRDNAGLDEVNLNGMQTKLALTLFNPNHYE